MPPLLRADRYLATRSPVRLRPLRRPAVGVVEIHGAIVPRVRFGVVPVASEERIVSALRAAREDDDVESVLLHIDSRGGSAVASDRIHHEVSRVAAEKPVIAYLADVAASGGYYIAAAAHSIIAQPDTITGSIGVVSARVVIGPLLTRLGIHTEVVKRGARADLFSSTRRLDGDEREAIERELDAFYRTFLAVVARGRRRTVEEIEPLAHGRVYSGRRAHAEGLCDHLGGFERALYQARACLGPAGRRLEPKIIQPRRDGGAARPIARAAAARAIGFAGREIGDRSPGLPPLPASFLAPLLAHPWLASIAEPLALGLEIPGEHVLAYWDDALEA